MEQCVVSTKHHKIAAEGDDVIVDFNYRKNKKDVDLRNGIEYNASSQTGISSGFA
jgi:hypothetical protein